MCACENSRMHTHKFSDKPARINVYLDMYVRVYVCVCIRMCVYTYVCVCANSP
jgi:hypothetical protein